MRSILARVAARRLALIMLEHPAYVCRQRARAHGGRWGARFYVSDPVMVDSAGSSVPVHMHRSGRHQDTRTALISLAQQGGEAGVLNGSFSGTLAPGADERIEFMLGVPFDRNHGNPLHAAPPLDGPAMFWSWQSGHKFVRLDLADVWSLHLGSTGCVSRSVLEGGHVGRFVLQGNPGCERPMSEQQFLEVLSGYNEVVGDLHRRFAGLRGMPPPNVSQSDLNRVAPGKTGGYDSRTATLRFGYLLPVHSRRCHTAAKRPVRSRHDQGAGDGGWGTRLAEPGPASDAAAAGGQAWRYRQNVAVRSR